ncbi:MAG: S8 family serine peptidase, partial [Dehalococcoidia bacterium]|nr:S8 family serine peptidase [Dehalococcoidia bacterium]
MNLGKIISTWLPRVAILTGGILLAFSWTSTAALAPGPDPDFEPGAILVRWGPGVRAQDATVTALGAVTVDSIPVLGVTKLRVAPGKEQEAIAALKSAGAQMAEPNYLRRIAFVPNDPLFACGTGVVSCQWNMSKINAPSAWDITMGSSNIIVAVVDTGIDTSHPDRPQNLILGADYIADPTGATKVSGDPQGHGTHVSGIVAARTNNGIGAAGVAPGASLMSVRVLDASGSGDTDTTAKGIVYAVDHGAKVVNLSLSGFDSSTVEEDAVNYAYSKGVMIVAAAGNCFVAGSGCLVANPMMYPAALPHVVAVAATDSSDNHTFYSEEGSYVDLAAPGGGSSSDAIWSTCTGSNYCQKAGTSMASPHVAGVAALVWSVNPSLTPDQ